MKRIGNLWPELVSFDNLYRAYRKARRSKRSHLSVERFEHRRELELARLRAELMSGEYRPGPYRTFMLYDTKARLISAAPFRDRIVHHALCNVIEPIFERTFIHDSYASRQGKGTHAAIRRYQQFARRNRYVLKCDIRKFFPSIDHTLLNERLVHKLKDRRVLDLAATIIDHSNPQVAVPGYFPGDDLFTSTERRRGLPIGNQTSQFFGNVFLNPLDHFVQETLGCRAYLRYVDDFVLLSNDKRKLAVWRDRLEEFLLDQRLWLHPTKRVISRVEDGIRLLGWRVWPQRICAGGDYVRCVRRRMACYQAEFREGRLGAAAVRQRLRSWLGHVRMLNSTWYVARLLGDIVFSRTATEALLRSRW